MKRYFRLLLILIFCQALFFVLTSFDVAPSWMDSRRGFPKSEKEWLTWFEDADYRYPLFAKRHFIGLGEASVDNVSPLISSPDKKIKFCALNILAEIKSLKSAPVLIEEIKQPDGEFAAYSLESLIAFPKGDWIFHALPHIRNRLNDSDTVIKISAVRAIAELGEESDIVLLENMRSEKFDDISIEETFKRNLEIGINKIKLRFNKQIKK